MPQGPFRQPPRDVVLPLQQGGPAAGSYARPLDTPADLRRRAPTSPGAPGGNGGTEAPAAPEPSTPGPRSAATETIARRAGALSDEIAFPEFVAGLIHGTFDAIVDATIRQMETYAGLVSAVAKTVDQFTTENISPTQARAWLAEQHPRDLVLDSTAEGGPQLRGRAPSNGEDVPPPVWLADFGLEGETLSDEVIEESLVPAARRKLGENRQQTLATLVLLGMNRVVVRDGTIAAKLRFRAAARDVADVQYALSQDTGGSEWGQRGSSIVAPAATMVSTVGVNVQAESELKAELFGEVKVNFASETLPLDRFVDQARLALLERHSRLPAPRSSGPAPSTGSTAPAQGGSA